MLQDFIQRMVLCLSLTLSIYLRGAFEIFLVAACHSPQRQSRVSRTLPGKKKNQTKEGYRKM